MSEKKPTLLSIRQRTQITTEQLAREAGVTLGQAYTVEIGGFVDQEIAERVIAAFTRLVGHYYSVDDIQLQNVPPRLPGWRTTRRLSKHVVGNDH